MNEAEQLYKRYLEGFTGAPHPGGSVAAELAFAAGHLHAQSRNADGTTVGLMSIGQVLDYLRNQLPQSMTSDIPHNVEAMIQRRAALEGMVAQQASRIQLLEGELAASNERQERLFAVADEAATMKTQIVILSKELQDREAKLAEALERASLCSVKDAKS